MKHAIQIQDIHNDTQFIVMVAPQGKCSFLKRNIELKKPIYAGYYLKFLADQEHCIVLFLCREDLENLKNIMVANGLLLSTPFFGLENEFEGLDHLILGVPEIFRTISTFDLRNDLVNLKINDGTFPIWKDEWCFSSFKLREFSKFQEIHERLRDQSIVMTKFRYDFDNHISAYVLHNDEFDLPAMSTRFWIDRRVTEAYNLAEFEKKQQKICKFISDLYYVLNVVAYTIHDQHGVIAFVSHETYGVFTPLKFSKFLSDLSFDHWDKLKQMFAETFDFNFEKWLKVYTSFDKEAYENGRWNIPLEHKISPNPISCMRKVINPNLENKEKMLTFSNIPHSFEISITTYNLLRNGSESYLVNMDRTSKRLKNWSERSIYVMNALKKAKSDIFCLQELDGKHGMLSSLHLKNSLPDHNYVISEMGKSDDKPCQCAIVYNANKFKLQGSKELWNKFRFVLARFLHIQSNKIFCIVSVDCKNGQSESKEATRVKQLEILFKYFNIPENHADVYLMCGSFYSDPQIASRTHGKYTFRNRVHSEMESNGFENISGHDITYHGCNPCTFDYIYFKGLPQSNLFMTYIERSIDSKDAETPLPDLEKGQGSDHIPVTLKLGFE